MNGKATHIFSAKNISIYAIFNVQSFNDMLTNDIVSFEQLGSGKCKEYRSRSTSGDIYPIRKFAIVRFVLQYPMILFVCVEVLRTSQPNGVMSSMVSLPNQTFTGQA